MDKIRCPLCGAEMTNFGGYTSHVQRCRELPTPDEMAQEIIDGATNIDMEKRHKISKKTLRKRLLCSSLWPDVRETYRQRRLDQMAHARRLHGIRERREIADDGRRRCSKCGILLEHPATMDCGDTCGVCCGKRAAQIPGTYDVEVFVPLYRMAW